MHARTNLTSRDVFARLLDVRPERGVEGRSVVLDAVCAPSETSRASRRRFPRGVSMVNVTFSFSFSLDVNLGFFGSGLLGVLSFLYLFCLYISHLGFFPFRPGLDCHVLTFTQRILPCFFFASLSEFGPARIPAQRSVSSKFFKTTIHGICHCLSYTSSPCMLWSRYFHPLNPQS